MRGSLPLFVVRATAGSDALELNEGGESGQKERE